jgi:hypothetical protein
VTSTKTLAVNAEELRNVFDLVSAGAPFENSAWICLDTGKLHWRSLAAGMQDEDFPKDIDDSDRYLAVPTQRDLDLGRPLALAFAAAELPDEYDTVAAFFRRRGAYGHFKDLLQAHGLLARWYEFENRSTAEALLAWCAENGIQLVEGSAEAWPPLPRSHP